MQNNKLKKYVYRLIMAIVCMGAVSAYATEENAPVPPKPSLNYKMDNNQPHSGSFNVDASMQDYMNHLPPEKRERLEAFHEEQENAAQQQEPEPAPAPLSHDIGR